MTELKVIKKEFHKGFKGWLFGESECPECHYYALSDASDDYWSCKNCGYSDDRFYGRIHHGRFYKRN